MLKSSVTIEEQAASQLQNYRNNLDNGSLRNIEAFEQHLQEVFSFYTNNGQKELEEHQDEFCIQKNQSNTSDKNRIFKDSFLKYLSNINVFLADKFFNSLLLSKDSKSLSYEEFAEPFILLKQGTLEVVTQIFFNIFCKDGWIEISALKQLLNFIPTKEYSCNVSFSNQIYSWEDLNELIDDTFTGLKTINFVLWKNRLYLNPTLLFILYSYFYESIPCFNTQLELYKLKLNKINPLASEIIFSGERSSSEKCKDYESRNSSIFSTRLEFTKNLFKNLESKIYSNDGSAPYSTFHSSLSPDASKNLENEVKGMVSPQIGRSQLKNFYDSDNMGNNCEFFEEMDLSTYGNEVKPEELFDEKDSYIKQINLERDEKIKRVSQSQEACSKPSKAYDLSKEIKYQGEIFLRTGYNSSNNPIMTKNFIVILNGAIYYYHSNNKSLFENYYKVNFLHGCLVKEELLNGRKFLFTIFLDNGKQETYYTDNENTITELIKLIRKEAGYRNIFDEYTLLKELGKGSHGTVYLSQHLITKELFAIKIIKKTKLTGKEWIKSKTEFEIMKRMKCNYISEFVDMYENTEYLFLIEEYFEGCSLSKYLDKNKRLLTESDVVTIVRKVAEGVKYCHELGIVHKDIKPDNILFHTDDEGVIEENSEVKLIDFGISCLLQNKEKIIDSSGTLIYAAPEVITNKPHDFSCDIWSLGILTYFLVCGQYPFKISKDKSEIADSIIKKEINQGPLKNKSKLFNDLIGRCLTSDTRRLNINDFINHPWFKPKKNN